MGSRRIGSYRSLAIVALAMVAAIGISTLATRGSAAASRPGPTALVWKMTDTHDAATEQVAISRLEAMTCSVVAESEPQGKMIKTGTNTWIYMKEFHTRIPHMNEVSLVGPCTRGIWPGEHGKH